MKTVLLIIDMQNDFCLPTGSLFVPGAEKDVLELSAFIEKEVNSLDHIIMTQDNHQVMNITHPVFWNDPEGNPPPPFTNITYEDILLGRWIPKYHIDFAKEYIKKLEEQNEFIHTIWPEHCLMGSSGAAIVSPVMDQVVRWARTGKYFDIVIKGSHPLTEHFGAFRANIPIDGAPETLLNMDLINKLRMYDRILIAGEAKSHCVANSIKQLFDFPDIMEKLIILNNCMSNIPNYDLLAQPIYNKALNLGAHQINTNELTYQL